MRCQAALLSRLLFAPSIAALLIAGAAVPVAEAQDKKFGYESKVGGGTGAEFTAAEKTKITDALDKIKDMTFTTKEGTYKGSDAEKVLRKMLNDGRMGKGVGADAGIYATTKGDGKATSDGDLMNIADHHIKDGDNKNLANTLVHEWLHTTQAGLSEAAAEAPAHQLGMQVYLDKGGDAADAPATDDAAIIEAYKKILDAAKAVVPDAKVPDKGADRKRSACGHEYLLLQNPGRVYFWSSTGGYMDSVLAAPNQMFFTLLNYHTPPNCDRILIFGTDRTVPSNPVGTMTVVDANNSGFFSRNDLVIPGLRYPFSATQDSTSQKLYVLDAHFGGQGIVSMQDLNADLVPDAMQPFAPRGFPGVDSAEAISWAELPGLGNGLAIDDMDNRGDSFLTLDEVLSFARDTNSDGFADFAANVRETGLSSFAPHFTRRPQPDETTVEIQCMPGHQVQIVMTDANGDANFGVIGGATGAPTGQPQLIPVPPLPNGQYVKAVDLTDNTQAALPSLIVTQTPGASPALLAAIALLLAGAGVVAARRRRGSEMA
jgi:hypothetical protein